MWSMRQGKTLGRLASQIAHRLKGKHKPTYAPHQDLGDHIVVINAGNVRVTGAKLTDKWYHQHTGYVGNLKSIDARQAAQGTSGARHRVCGQGHAAEGPARPPHVQEAARIRRQHSSPSSPAAEGAGAVNVRNQRHGIKLRQQYLLRHRPPQDLERAGLSHQGHRQGLHQRPAAGRVLRTGNRPHDRAAAVRRRADGRASSTSMRMSRAAASPARPARSAMASPAP